MRRKTMIKFDSDDPGKLKIAGEPEEIAVEVGALAKTIYDIIKEYNEEMAMMYEMNLMHAVVCAFETDQEEKKKFIEEHERQMKLIHQLGNIRDFLDSLKEGLEKEKEKRESNIKDIRRSEFDSDEEFTKWFRGTEGKDEE